MRQSLPLFFALILAAGCDSNRLLSAKFYSATKQYLRAVKAFEAFAAARPDDPRSAEALVRSGEMYASLFHRCLEARRNFEADLRRFPGREPWAGRAKAGLMGCPDYFPIDNSRRWVYGDTESQGANMRLQWELSSSAGSARGEIASVLYAGSKKIRDSTEVYDKKDWTVWQEAGGAALPILKFPYRAGMTWTGKKADGETVYLIESDSQTVETAAGAFTGCLKVRETDSRFPDSWTYQYYAPDVGRVKTTIGGPGFENPNTELIKFDKIGH